MFLASASSSAKRNHLNINNEEKDTNLVHSYSADQQQRGKLEKKIYFDL